MQLVLLVLLFSLSVFAVLLAVVALQLQKKEAKRLKQKINNMTRC